MVFLATLVCVVVVVVFLVGVVVVVMVVRMVPFSKNRPILSVFSWPLIGPQIT